MVCRPKQCRRRSGMVLITVLAVIMIMSIFVVVTLSQNLSQTTLSQISVDQVKAQQLVQGAFWKAYADMNGGGNPSVASETLDGKTFTVTVPPRPASSAVAYEPKVTY